MSLQKNIKLLTWFNFFTDFKLYSAIIIIYFAHVTHSYTLGASIFSIAYILSAFFDIPTSIFADRMGRKKSVVLGALTGVMYAVFYAIGTNYWFLVVGAVFDGLSRAFYSGNNNALLHNLLSEEGLEDEYHAYSGKLNGMFQFGLASSGLIGGFIANWSFTYLMWLSVFPQILCLFLSFHIIDSKKTSEISVTLLQHLKEGFISFVQNSNLRLLSISSILGYGLGEAQYQIQPAFFNALLPLWLVGVVRSLSNFSAAISFQVSGKIIDRFGILKVLLGEELYFKILSFIALIFSSVASPFILSATSLAYGVGSVARDTLMQKEFTDKQRATMSSLNTFVGSLFYGICIFIAGVFVDKIGTRNVLLLIQILLLPTLWFTWRFLQINKQAL